MNFSPKNVLIVEDDILLSVIEKRLVQKMGHHVIDTIDNGQSALRMIKDKAPDVILMDIKLKGDWDGISTVREIRKFSAVPVIYLSGCSDNESRNRASQLGYAGFLIKPVQMEDLQAAFEAAFGDEAINKAENQTVTR